MQPGETITPGGQPPAPSEPAPEQPAQVPSAPAPDPLPNPAPAPPAPDTPWQFQAESPGGKGGVHAVAPATAVRWTASEYIAHQKGLEWYGLLALGIVAVVLLTFLITREIISTVVVGVVGIMFGIFAARPPQVLEYVVDHTGVHVGPKFYPYGRFRTFSVLQEGGMHAILLMPLQRFGMPLTIYYEPKDEDGIIEVIGNNLPHEDRQPGAIDNFMRKIRF
jgi:hypothetical protein